MLRAICDVVFNAHRPAVPALSEKVALRVAAAVALARNGEAAALCYELVRKVPARLWAGEYENRLRAALHKNEALLSTTWPADRSATIAQLLSRGVDRERAS